MQPLLKCPKSRMQNKMQTMSYELFSSENILEDFCAISISMIIRSIKKAIIPKLELNEFN